MTSTLSVPIELIVDVREIEGGGFWGEVRQMPGCAAQDDTLDGLRAAIVEAIGDWLGEPGVQTEEQARKLAAIQGTEEIPEGPYPLPYAYEPPASWTEADEDE
jgi:predicted RNase H-like HicB family nuclease